MLEPFCEAHVLGHDGGPVGVDGAEIGVLEESDEVCLGGFLEGEQGTCLEAVISEILSEFAYESLKGEFAYEQFSSLLVLADLAQGDGAGFVLDASLPL